MPYADPEKKRAYSAAYNAAHREERRAYNVARDRTAYNTAHREEARAYSAAYNAAHREERRAYNVAYEATHQEERRAYRRTHYLYFDGKAFAIANLPVELQPIGRLIKETRLEIRKRASQ